LPKVPVTRPEEIMWRATRATSSRKSWYFKAILLRGLVLEALPATVARSRSLSMALYKRLVGEASVFVASGAIVWRGKRGKEGGE